MFDPSSKGMIPTTVADTQTPSSSKPEHAPELDVQLGNLSSTISKLKKDAKRFQTEVCTQVQTSITSPPVRHLYSSTKIGANMIVIFPSVN